MSVIITTDRHGAGLGSGLEQRASLRFNNCQIVFGWQIPGLHRGQLANFAFGNHRGCCGEPVQDFETVGFNQQVECARKQEVPHQDGGLVAPNCLGSRFPASQIAFVHHVIVQQRGGVDELHGRCKSMCCLVRRAHGMCRNEGYQGSQALAARRHNVTGQIRNDRYRACCAGRQQGLDLTEVLGHERLHPIHNGTDCLFASWFWRKGHVFTGSHHFSDEMGNSRRMGSHQARRGTPTHLTAKCCGESSPCVRNIQAIGPLRIFQQGRVPT